MPFALPGIFAIRDIPEAAGKLCPYLSSPRLGERAFKTMDDMNNLGLKKRMSGEVDVFQLDRTHELYGHLNLNYVRLPVLPTYGNYGQILDSVARGDCFIGTGVWGDGSAISRKIIPLEETREFGHMKSQWTVEAKNWKWARLAVWDVAGDGAFTNPI
jgi:hypothetical protein